MIKTYSRKELTVARVACEDDFLFFVRFFFRQTELKKFIVQPFHEKLAKELQNVAEGRTKRLIINIAPRFGKTQMAVKSFIAWSLARNPKAKFIHLSYSDDLALDNSNEVRELVKSDMFKTLFPEVELSQTSDSKKKWYTKDGGGVYATSTGGQITGFGAGSIYDQENEFFNGAIIIDDPIKPEDATNPNIRDKQNNRYKTTIKNRVNSRNTPIIVIMQRLDEEDLSGYLQTKDSDEWKVVKFPVIDENNNALWPAKMTVEEAEKLRKEDPDVFDMQYMQDPKPKTGLLYNEFKTYSKLPDTILRTRNQTDVADSGTDSLCSVNYVLGSDGFIYVTDVLHTKESGDVTEPKLAEMLDNGKIIESYFESNGGGSAFARSVNRFKKGITKIFTPHQTRNKESKIINNATTVNEFIIMPEGWHYRWPDFHKEVTRFKKNFKTNKHDDAPDTLTEIVIREKTVQRTGSKPL